MPETDPIALAAELIAIDSVNPLLEPGAAGEAEIVQWCAQWLSARGFRIETVGADPTRPSIIARAGHARGGRTLLLNGHLDTVGAAVTVQQRSADLTPSLADGRLHGRGSYDMKAGLAAMLVAAERAVAAGIDGEVVLALVADEEFGSIGTEETLARIRADGAVIAEPTGGEVVLAHRGFAWFEIELTGVAAHGSLPEQGIDAIAHAGLVLRALDALAVRLHERGAHPLLQPGTVRVATIAGGSDPATVADRCVLTVERRFLPGESPDEVEAELQDLLTAVAASEPRLRARLSRRVARGAFEADADAAITRSVLAAVERVDGSPAVTRGEPFWTDAGLVAEAGIPVLLIGPDGDGPHADVEWVDVASVHRLTAVLTAVIVDFCA
ncbi:M20/M25/M40 family metallo-hydrolase [Microbacteriaceae bacterium VKM Ac-2854]|nr:M20/M25/M40 family metallo-hydrolase [Microbacteriaceae bacterium VKM Ac-2854]